MEISGGGLEILVAEDNTALASVLQFNLEMAGFSVTVARNGQEAWDWMQSRPFDLVLTDEQMPGMTGRQFCEQIRAAGQRESVPVFMLTAKGFELDRKQLREDLGIDTVFVKPFSPREVVQAVRDRLATTVY